MLTAASFDLDVVFPVRGAKEPGHLVWNGPWEV